MGRGPDLDRLSISAYAAAMAVGRPQGWCHGLNCVLAKDILNPQHVKISIFELIQKQGLDRGNQVKMRSFRNPALGHLSGQKKFLKSKPGEQIFGCQGRGRWGEWNGQGVWG